MAAGSIFVEFLVEVWVFNSENSKIQTLLYNLPTDYTYFKNKSVGGILCIVDKKATIFSLAWNNFKINLQENS